MNGMNDVQDENKCYGQLLLSFGQVLPSFGATLVFSVGLHLHDVAQRCRNSKSSTLQSSLAAGGSASLSRGLSCRDSPNDTLSSSWSCVLVFCSIYCKRQPTSHPPWQAGAETLSKYIHCQGLETLKLGTLKSCLLCAWGGVRLRLPPERCAHLPARCVTAQSPLQRSTYARMQTSQDARKAKLYGKIGKLIVQAVKAGGTDVVGNPRLKEVLKQAQQASIPKDIIERNVKRASDKSQADFQEVHIIALPHLPCCSLAWHANCYVPRLRDSAFLTDMQS